MAILNIIESAYRATLEEQDDTIVWITHALKGAGADIGVLLRGSAVSYAVKVQSVAPLSFGDVQQKQAPDIAKDVASLVEKGIKVHVVSEELSERGISEEALLPGLTMVSGKDVPELFDSYEAIWHW